MESIVVIINFLTRKATGKKDTKKKGNSYKYAKANEKESILFLEIFHILL